MPAGHEARTSPSAAMPRGTARPGAAAPKPRVVRALRSTPAGSLTLVVDAGDGRLGRRPAQVDLADLDLQVGVPAGVAELERDRRGAIRGEDEDRDLALEDGVRLDAMEGGVDAARS